LRYQNKHSALARERSYRCYLESETDRSLAAIGQVLSLMRRNIE